MLPHHPPLLSSYEPLLDLLIKLDVGAAEPVDRLLGIADQEQLPRSRLVRIIGIAATTSLADSCL